MKLNGTRRPSNILLSSCFLFRITNRSDSSDLCAARKVGIGTTKSIDANNVNEYWSGWKWKCICVCVCLCLSVCVYAMWRLSVPDTHTCTDIHTHTDFKSLLVNSDAASVVEQRTTDARTQQTDGHIRADCQTRVVWRGGNIPHTTALTPPNCHSEICAVATAPPPVATVHALHALLRSFILRWCKLRSYEAFSVNIRLVTANLPITSLNGQRSREREREGGGDEVRSSGRRMRISKHRL